MFNTVAVIVSLFCFIATVGPGFLFLFVVLGTGRPEKKNSFFDREFKSEKVGEHREFMCQSSESVEVSVHELDVSDTEEDRI